MESVEDYFNALIGDAWKTPDFLFWPPNAFCLSAALLQRTGAYIRLIKKWPPHFASAGKPAVDVAEWRKEMTNRGKAWWQYVNYSIEWRFKKKNPKLVANWPKVGLHPNIIAAWDVIKKHRNVLVSDLIKQKERKTHEKFWCAIFETVAAADEASAGIGVSVGSKFENSPTPRLDYFLYAAQLKLYEDRNKGTSATLCFDIPEHLGTILPKMHTPQSGLTLRSLTHNLAFLRPSEVRVTFWSMPSSFSSSGTLHSGPSHAINILYIPWPKKVLPNHFHPSDCRYQRMEDGFRFFTYRAETQNRRKRATAVTKLLEAGKELVGQINGVLLPEMALQPKEAGELAAAIHKKNPRTFLIAGEGSASKSGKPGNNKAVFSPWRYGGTLEQSKHHRWQLDGGQIDQYGLGSKLDPTKTWWEHIPIGSRSINLACVSERVTMSMLICEDLARQDPIADVIRSIGPNLVVALLMDGPQLSGRWPAHYATVFADDPGSSVLTVTSIGMSSLCRPKGQTAKRTIGLWKDRLQGFREIDLPEGAEALVLTLTLRDKEEWSADGRTDYGQSTYLTLNGVHPIFTDTRSKGTGLT